MKISVKDVEAHSSVLRKALVRQRLMAKKILFLDSVLLLMSPLNANGRKEHLSAEWHVQLKNMFVCVYVCEKEP